jgi:hypothetical protein
MTPARTVLLVALVLVAVGGLAVADYSRTQSQLDSADDRIRLVDTAACGEVEGCTPPVVLEYPDDARVG